jgi:aryl-alcohol dehydrogenase-like predicted oxidoreductase
MAREQHAPHPARSGASVFGILGRALTPPSAPSAASAPAEPTGSARTIVAPRRLGDSDIEVFPIGLGSSVFGWTVGRPDAARILNRFTELGGDFIDTADNYGGGYAETIIGGWMAARRNRDRLVVATKVGRNADLPGLRRANVLKAVDASLERLRTDRIDVLYFHFDDDSVPLEDSLGAAHELIQAGKVRSLGASNFSAARLLDARVLVANGLPRFSSIQEEYSLVSRSRFEGDVALAARAQGLGVVPHFALAHGFLTGAYRTRADGIGTARRQRAAQYITRPGLRVLGVVEHIAETRHITPATVALAWLLARPGVVAPVVSADEPEHVDAMIAAASLVLEPSERAALDRVSL